MNTSSRSPRLVSERYQIEAELGRGGMGAVYRAVDTVDGQVVALKTLQAGGSGEVALFEREYRTLASLQHPSVIRVFDFGITGEGERYYTMELLEGGDLYGLAPVPWRKLCEYLRDVATSLLLLHARRLVHRDVSPRNVRLDVGGRAKLLDFGALTSFQIAAEIVGTPLCTPPEVLRQELLDQRADLFSLGVLGYWTLTRRKPYAINQFQDAELAWSTPPVAPSRWVPEIPKALDALLLSLLSVEASGRPASAAEVIDRLGAIAELDDEVLAGVAESHLLSCELVGREREQAQLRQHLERASRGQGGVVVVEGQAGSGRTRLVAELSIQARVSGITSLYVDAKAHAEPAGVLVALSRELLATLPLSARTALAAYPVLAQLLGAATAEQRSSSAPTAPEFTGAGEKRAQLQTAFAAWLLEVAESRPVLVAIDDAQLADAVSLGALVGLAHAVRRSRVLLLATLSGAEEALGSASQLVRVGARVKLRALDLMAVEQLVTSAMGDVPHRTRLCAWLYATSSGNPSQVIELVRYLIARGIIRYENGAWVLPSSLSEQELPGSVSDVLAARIGQLSAGALRLAQLLALHSGSVSEALCQKIARATGMADVKSQLAELVSKQILAEQGAEIRWTHEGLRALLLERAGDGELPALHLALGHALLASVRSGDETGELVSVSTGELCVALQAGWHLMHGGDEARGRELLRRAGLELTQRGEGFAEIVPALEAALRAYREQGRSRFECGHLLIPLTLAGNWMDWRLSYRYGDELFQILAEATGISLAAKLARFLPRRLALGLALVIAVVRHSLGATRPITRSFRESIVMLIGLASATLGTCATLLDSERAQRLLELLRPMQWFPTGHPVRLANELQLALADCAAGRYAECRARARAVLAQLRQPGGVAGIPETARQQIEMGVIVLLGNIECYRLDGSVQQTLADLDNLSTAAAREAAVGIRTNYHAGRGERAKLEGFREEMDVLAAQGGSTWRPDVLVPRNLWWSYAQCEDVLGLKRMVGHLQRIGSDHPGLASTAQAAHACYLAERGMAAQALERYEAMFEAAVQQTSAITMRFVGAYARILRATGNPLRARTVCENALRIQSQASLEFECLSYSVRLELALATAELGQADEATAALQTLLSAQHGHDNPLIHGLTHKALAQVALLQRDANAFSTHARAMHDWFEKTENPALLGQCQRLVAEARAAGIGTQESSSLAAGPEDAEEIKVASAFRACRGPAERLQTALDLVVQHTQAAQGYLYLLEPEGLRFAAPAVGFEPPEALLRALAERLSSLFDDEQETALMTSASAPDDGSDPAWLTLPATAGQGTMYQVLPLTVSRQSELVVVGVIALVPGADRLDPARLGFVREIAHGIYDSGDVRTVYFQHATSAYVERRGAGADRQQASAPAPAAVP